MMTEFKAKPKKLNWRKMIWVVILAGVVGYSYGQPYLEKWTGWDLPTISDRGNASNSDRGQNDRGLDWNVQPNGNKKHSGGTASNSSYLTDMGKKDRKESPAGLVYGVGGGGEHRVDHVMRHAVDMPSRPVHSVFEGSQEEILKMLDEAYELIKSNSDRVRTKRDKERNFRASHVVDMKRKIGYLGGKRGKRDGYPARSKLNLVLDNDKFVITAYPDK